MNYNLENACNGRSASQGGLNVNDLKKELIKLLPNHITEIQKASRAELQKICYDNLLSKKETAPKTIKKIIKLSPKKRLFNAPISVNYENELQYIKPKVYKSFKSPIKLFTEKALEKEHKLSENDFKNYLDTYNLLDKKYIDIIENFDQCMKNTKNMDECISQLSDFYKDIDINTLYNILMLGNYKTDIVNKIKNSFYKILNDNYEIDNPVPNSQYSLDHNNIFIGNVIGKGAGAEVYSAKLNQNDIVFRKGGSKKNIKLLDELYPYFPVYNFVFVDKKGVVWLGMEKLEPIIWNDEIFGQAMQFLSYMSLHKLQHNDITPNNLMMSRINRLKPIDFSSPNTLTMYYSQCGNDLCAMVRSLLTIRNENELRAIMKNYLSFIYENKDKLGNILEWTSFLDGSARKYLNQIESHYKNFSNEAILHNINIPIIKYIMENTLKYIKDNNMDINTLLELFDTDDEKAQIIYENFNDYIDKLIISGSAIKQRDFYFLELFRSMMNNNIIKNDFINNILMDMAMSNYENTSDYIKYIEKIKPIIKNNTIKLYYNNICLSNNDFNILIAYVPEFRNIIKSIITHITKVDNLSISSDEHNCFEIKIL